jgi:hypothetical protein
MGTPKQFTVIPKDLNTTPEDFGATIRHIDKEIASLAVDKLDLQANVATVTIPDEDTKRVSQLLGQNYILSPNTKLNIIG